MQTVSQPKTCEGISLADVVKFFRRNQLRIVGWVVAGLFFSTAYLLLAPKKYEARWQMQMAQLADYDVVTYMATYKNIEEPANLIQRLRVPVAYPVAVWKSCGMSEGGEFGDYLAGIFVIQATKNANSTVDMTFRATSVPQARQCAEAIASMIETQQHDLIEEQLTGMQEELLRYRHALHAEEQQLGAIKESGLANWGYLVILDKLSAIRMRINALEIKSLISQKHPAKLTAPIFVSSKPVAPKIWLLLLFGTSLGLLLGMLHALIRERWRRMA